jgi:hypothetical protein
MTIDTNADVDQVEQHEPGAGDVAQLGDPAKEFDACWKCAGRGYLPGLEHSDNARCWACHSQGGVWVTAGTLAKREKAREARARRAEKKAAADRAAQEAAWTTWEADNFETIAAARLLPASDFQADMVAQLDEHRPLTERQAAAVHRIHDRMLADALAAEQAQDVPTGRIEITGEVVSIKEVDNAYGSTIKMLVRDDRGFKVWGTMPSAIMGQRCTGKRVAFAAAVEPSRDDAKFGLFKRPTKARLV